MADSSRVAAVVVTYDALPWIESCLDSLAGVETVVVDNGSSDGTVAFVRERYPDVRLVEAENRGLGAGWNIGIRDTTAPYVLLLNADAWMTEGSLDRLVDFAEARPRAAVVGPRLLNTDGTLQRSVRGYPTVWRLATEYLFLRKLAPRSSALNAFYGGGFDHDEVRSVEVVMGACMLLRREAVDQVGECDEDYFLFSEETDWCFRFRKARLGGRLLSRRRVRPRARRVPQRAPVPREPPRSPALPLEAPRAEGGRARAPPIARLVETPQPRVPRRARACLPGRRGLARLGERGDARRALT